MRAKVLFFGMLKDIAGFGEEHSDLPGAASLGDVFDHYADRFPKLRDLAACIVLARNREFGNRSTAVADGDEIAFLPPVSGGSDLPPEPAAPIYTHRIEDSGGHFFALTRQPIDGGAIARSLLRGEDGAFVNFEGVVRNNTRGRATRYLDYEGYEAMAVEAMARIGLEIASSRPIGRIAMVHRLGGLAIGETSVVVAVTAPHRRPAFEAALEGIDRLKRLVPIWKKEHFADGEVWVEGAWDNSVLPA